MSKRMEALLCVLTLIVSWGVYSCCAESGFLSLDCGGIGNRRDAKTSITWTPDDKFIHAGYRKVHIDPSLEFYQQSLRLFPKPLNKSCYSLPIQPDVPFLLRLYFVGMDYTNKIPNFNYSIEAQDMLSLRKPTLQSETPQVSEKILVSGGQTLYICLIRESEDVDPFISSIELRPLQQGMYAPHVGPGLMLRFLTRRNFGASELLRYPQDQFDRAWYPLGIDGADNVTSVEPISTYDTQDLPPPVVMQTAVSTADAKFDFQFSIASSSGINLLLLYFAEIMNSSGSRIFDIFINDVKMASNLRLIRDNSAIELPLMARKFLGWMTLSKASNSAMGPMLNALEWYETIISSTLITSAEDVEALATVKELLNLSNWISDPCFAYPWEGIVCSDSSVPVRVSEINLSNRNLAGSIPSSFGNMTALITISLENNNLTGGLPNFSKLVMLEKLYLQNNFLSGHLPDWLSELPNLKELSIENNNFSGVIRQKLQDTNLLKFTYEGNRYLCIKREECRLSSYSNRRRGKTVTVEIVCPITIGALLLLVGISIYTKKLRRKDIVDSGTKGSTQVNRQSDYVRGQDHLSVLVPNTPKSRSFSLKEMMTATKNFSDKIGHGGFGSVFLGELAEGEQIAVKVLSLFSNQGIVQFLNEIELLSRVHHRNLVCLLGYCNESRDLMLVYEYMSGGSLSDHFYGRNVSKYPKLDWKTRLKIALNAAQGLEYLHRNCTPKIIHRDIKTDNILLDANLNGKLADFGLSRAATDDVSHVITAVRGTAGYVDPKYFTTHVLTEKSDVYSFGVVLLEIICGRRVVDITLSEPQMDLVKWVTPLVTREEHFINVTEFVDKSLDNNYNRESITSIAKLAMRCIDSEPSERPSASDVVMEIKDAMKFEI